LEGDRQDMIDALVQDAQARKLAEGSQQDLAA
jgi:hypothetical protein